MDSNINDDTGAAITQQLQLPNTWTFWHLARQGTRRLEETNYQNALKPLGPAFSTAQGFWSIYSHLTRPIPLNNDIYCFLAGIQPAWEHPANKNGGRLLLRLKKAIGSRIWEHLLLALCAGRFEGLEVVGVVLSSKYSECLVAIWCREGVDVKGLREMVRVVLGLPESMKIEYKLHG